MKRFFKFVLLALFCLVALVVAAAYYFGILNWKKTETTIRVKASEVSTSVRNEVGQIGTSPRLSGADAVKAGETCRANLRRIESAKKASGEKRGTSVGPVSQSEVVEELGGEMPKCPSGGSYTLGTLEMNARCSVSTNGNTDPADDHMLRSY